MKCALVPFSFVVLLGSLHATSLPVVNQPLVPASVPPGSPAFALTVHGTGFTATSVVNWNGQPRPTSVLSTSLLQASIAAADVAKAGTASVTVTNPGVPVSNVVFFPVTGRSTSIAMAGKQVFPNCGAAVAGDFNGDGKLDVAWGDANSETVNISLGNGKGGFLAPIPFLYVTMFPGPAIQMIAGDFNGDGKLDVAAMDANGDVKVLLGNGDGTLSLAASYPQNGFGSSIGAADLNQDGKLDLYISGHVVGPSWFDIYLSTGMVQRYSLAGLSALGGVPAIGDFTGNGKLDLIVPISNPGNGQLYVGNGDGTFVASNVVGSQFAALAADFNGDGKLDFMTESGCVLLGNGDGTFGAVGGCVAFAGFGITGVGDFNGDGILDTAVPVTLFSPGISPQLAINLGNGNGTFQKSILFPAGSSPGNLFLFGSVGDFNGDGKLDAITGNGFLLLQTTASVSTTSLAFGNQTIGTTSPLQVVTLTNIGSAALPLQAPSITGTNAADFVKTTTCGTSLGAAASCTISVKFKPKAAAGRTASLNVRYTGVGSPQTVALSGVGVAPPSSSLTPASLPFPTQLVGTTSAPQTATLTNTGTVTVNISKIGVPMPFHQTNNCPAALGSGASCQILVTYAPTARGAASAKLSVTSNTLPATKTVSLTGTATVVTISPIGVNFGVQKVGVASAAVPITLTNGGGSALTISQIAFTGTNPGDFSQTSNCGATLAAKKSCTISAVFKPTAIGARSGNLSVTDSGGASPQTIPMAGIGN